MEWTRSETIALASPRCNTCVGVGLKVGRGGKTTPCKCVLRSIFRACHNKFRECVERRESVSRPTQESWGGGPNRPSTWGRKVEEYLADFCLIAKRTLTPEEHQLFRFHFLLGADWRLCSARLSLTRGEFFNRTYRIEEKLGQVFRELEPYSLFPLDEYFGGTLRNGTLGESSFLARVESGALYPPMRPKSEPGSQPTGRENLA
jgi:hypothetical protein